MVQRKKKEFHSLQGVQSTVEGKVRRTTDVQISMTENTFNIVNNSAEKPMTGEKTTKFTF